MIEQCYHFNSVINHIKNLISTSQLFIVASSFHSASTFGELNLAHPQIVMRSRTLDSTRNAALKASFEISWHENRVNCFKVLK